MERKESVRQSVYSAGNGSAWESCTSMFFIELNDSLQIQSMPETRQDMPRLNHDMPFRQSTDAKSLHASHAFRLMPSTI